MTLPRILYEDRAVLALEKPAGQHTFSRRPGEPSLGAWLLCQRPFLREVGGAAGPAIVHRLDRPTSGLVLAAADEENFVRLRAVLGTRDVLKVYLALVEGSMATPQKVEAALGSRYRRSRKVQVAEANRRLRGVRSAESLVEPLAVGRETTLCRVSIHTGVRHQIRAHLAILGHPIWGDTLYGAKLPPPEAGRIMLHSFFVRFPHPLRGPVTLGCPPDEMWRETLRQAGILTALEEELGRQKDLWLNAIMQTEFPVRIRTPSDETDPTR